MTLLTRGGTTLLVLATTFITAAPLPALRVSENQRFLVTADGRPFFWLGDTAWELFHRLNREETERYLADRAAKGFNVIQAVALAELDGQTVPNPQGHLPLVAGQILRPAVIEGPDNDYWDDIELTLRSAERKGLCVGLIESRPFLTQSPDQSLLANGGGEGLERVAALRGDGYALISTPDGKPFRVRLDRLSGTQVKAWWFDPRTGQPRAIGQFPRAGEREFTPPGAPGVANDWVLALDDPQRGLGAPRAALEPFDWRGLGGFDTYRWHGFLICNNRWGGGNGRIWFKDHGERWSFWTEHTDDLNGGHVKSFPHAGIGWMWGDWAPNQALPIPLDQLAVAESDWTVTLPPTEPNQSFVVYYQLYTSAVPNPKSDGAKISGDLAIIIHREDFPFEAWGKKLGEFDVGGRKWIVVRKSPAIGNSTYIIMAPVAPVARREGQRLAIESFDLKPCVDFCVAQGFYPPMDYLLTIQAGWESRFLHGVLRSENLKLTVGKKDAEPVRLPLASSISGGRAP